MQQMPPAQPYNAVPHGPGPYVIVPVPAGTATYDRYMSRASRIIGVTQIVIGSLCIIFNIVEAVMISLVGPTYYGAWGIAGHGFWCGILFIVTGGLGIGAGTRKTKCSIVGFMVMCIISASFTTVLLSLGICGSVIPSYYSRRCRGYGYDYQYDYYYSPPCSEADRYRVIISMEALMAAAALVEAILSIWGAALCCKSGICCCSNQTPMYSSPSGYITNNSQVVYVTQPQGWQPVLTPQPMTACPQGMYFPPPYDQPGLTGPPPPNAGGNHPPFAPERATMFPANPSNGYDQQNDVNKRYL